MLGVKKNKGESMKNILLIMAISFSASFAAALTCDLDQVCAEYGFSAETCRSMPFCKIERRGGGCYPLGPQSGLARMCAIGSESRAFCDQSSQIARALYPEGCEWREPEQYCRAKVGL